MILTIFRSARALYHRDDLVKAWDAWTFEPQPLLTREWPPGVSRVRWSSAPVEVHAPLGAHLVPHRYEPERYPPRLVTYFDPIGLDAESVFWLASRGERGFRLAIEPAQTREEVRS